jgi:membrane-associated phospholipid phosphatase
MAVLSAVFTGLAIYVLDGRVARWLQPVAAENRAVLGPFVSAVEFAFAFPVSKFATGLAIVVASLVLFALARRRVGWLLLFVGATHLTARLTAGVLKNVFLRARPAEGLAGGEWHDRFFIEGGSSFPSGHAVHFWALFFALAFAFPRLRVPALVLAVCVSIARVAVNDHYVSDVLASVSIAAFVACGYALWLLPRAARTQMQLPAALDEAAQSKAG